MRNCLTILTTVGLLLAWEGVALAQDGKALPPEAEQVLFLIDDSLSMMETAFDPDHPSASRWEVLQQAYPQWLEHLGPETLVGALSVGGLCGSPPPISLPVGPDRTRVTNAISSARPLGWTNLNATLKAAPDLFVPSVRGSKRIILLSDGLNTCPPKGSTCEIARELHRDHGIVIDVVAWITEPGMINEFKCVTKATGGIFTAPRSLDEWINIPLPTLDPWRYVVLALGVLTLLLASMVLYRHGFHVLGWDTGRATLAAGILVSLGALVLYLVLFAHAGMVAALLGVAVLAGTLVVASRQRSQRDLPAAPTSSLWLIIGLLLFASSLTPRLSFAAEISSMSCDRIVQGLPRYHHILVLDVSGSVVQHMRQMKSLLACYAEMYALPHEEISLIIFGSDHIGTVKELRTFTVPPSGSTTILNMLLDDLEIQNPKSTKTYFRPLADFLNQFLRQVRLQPVVLVVSDGKSDGYADKVPFKEIPFESFGRRGIYNVMGMNGWKVAIQGGSGLDLTALFQRPVVARGKGTPTPPQLGPAIDPCLIDPELFAETDEQIILRPRWNPFAHVVEGSVSIAMWHNCVARFRSFTVELRHGNETLSLGKVDHALINQTPRLFTFSLFQPAASVKSVEGTVQILLDQRGTTRTIYPQRPPIVTLKEVSYLSAFSMYWAVSMLLVGLAVAAVQCYRVRERNRPEVIKVLGGNAVSLPRFHSVTIGGEGCMLVVPGAPPQQVLAFAERADRRRELILRPGNGIRMRVSGTDTIGQVTYHLGQPLQFIDKDENIYNAALYPGTSKDIGFGPTIPRSENGSGMAGAFSSFDGNPFGNDASINAGTYI